MPKGLKGYTVICIPAGDDRPNEDARWFAVR
jgi:hypothetical protein